MFWFRKKKLSDYQKAMSQFNSDMKSIKEINQYDNINKIYKDIKRYYEDKRVNEVFDIRIEKIRIERNLGLHPNNFMSFVIAFCIAIMGSLFYFMIQITISYFGEYGNGIIKFGVSLFFLCLLFKYTLGIFRKEIIKDKPRNLMLNISLEVLKDIEKEIAEELSKTKEEAGKLDKQQRIEQYFNRGKIINEIAPAFAEIAVGLVSKVFKKSK